MSICNIPAQKVVLISEGATINEAAELMKSENVGAVVVVKDKDNDKTAVGIATDRDLTKLIADNVDLKTTHISEAMSDTLLTVKEDDGLYDIIHAMSDKKVRRAPIVDEDNKVVGMITSDDLIQLIGQEVNMLATLIHSQVTA